MIWLTGFVPLLVGLLASRSGRWRARSVSPAMAAPLLAALACTIAATTAVFLGLVAVVGLAGLIPALRWSEWSAEPVREALMISTPVAGVIGLIAAVLAARVVAHVVRFIRASRQASCAVAKLPVVGDLSVVPGPEAHAFTAAGRVVVSSVMLRALDSAEGRALIAHERAHVRLHHHQLVELADLAAAANPLVLPLARAVRDAVERWADAAAVVEVGDPAIVARAVGRAALARSSRPHASLAAAGGDVVGRVRDLLEPPARRGWVTALIVAAMVICWLSTVIGVIYSHGVVELNELAATRGGG